MDYLLGVFAESLGGMLVWILPVGLLYGKLYRKLHFATIALGLPFGALVDALAKFIIGQEHFLLIGIGSCIAGIEIAALVVDLHKSPDKA